MSSGNRLHCHTCGDPITATWNYKDEGFFCMGACERRCPYDMNGEPRDGFCRECERETIVKCSGCDETACRKCDNVLQMNFKYWCDDCVTVALARTYRDRFYKR
jgi:hypothetical protein